MMPGMIMLWAHSVESIPSGWHICDGTMGTPDLSNYFIIGCSATRPPGYHGGSFSHDHGFTGSGHSHTIPEGTGLAAGEDYALETEVDPAVGDTDVTYSYPPMYSLCYIMKL
ncbi:unnamed protein product [marine sediment metagenome]|uniref:Phage tail collar domain-containing protein n=1 Tax=marine sediment metagenome TaxID=412755 RepID=X1J7X3_9ZZZZ